MEQLLFWIHADSHSRDTTVINILGFFLFWGFCVCVCVFKCGIKDSRILQERTDTYVTGLTTICNS